MPKMNQQSDSLKKNLRAISGEAPESAAELAFESHRTGRPGQKSESDESFGRSSARLRAFPLGPFAFNPCEQANQRRLQHGHVLREQKESERQHPEPEHRQEGEDAAEDQQQCQGNPNQPRRRLAQPTDEARRSSRQLVLEPGKVPVEFDLMIDA